MSKAVRESRSLLSAPTDELASQLTALARAGQTGSEQWTAVQNELARRRVDDARSTPLPTRRSLRTDILTRLAQAPSSTPTELATALTRSTTVVSRMLATLLEAELVRYTSSPDDGRIRQYSLTAADVVAPDGTVAMPSPSEEDRQYLGLVVAAAVRARRRTNDLKYAADRLGRVLDKALEIRADDIALLARRELVTTLRQAERTEDFRRHMVAFSDFATGKSAIRADLVQPATACMDYELGRAPGLPEQDRLDHLAAAATAFQRCQSLPEAHDWAPREGWALLARAEIWRRQTEFGVALGAAKRAESVFTAYGDTYGMAESTRIQGFCERLRGNFDTAIATLERAQTLAQAGSADRSLADVLLQAGDAYRCLRRYDEASDKLNSAIELAKELERPRTLGFSLTALAAVRYKQDDVDAAWVLAEEAEPHLRQSQAGAPFNQRRRAVIASRLASNGDPTMASVSVDLFTQSMERYRELGSPAGIAACYVGLGAVEKHLSPRQDDTQGLVEVASSGSGRLLLPMDPWVPNLLANWAEESGNTEIRRVADWVVRSDRSVGEVDEMAGEPRLLSEALAA